MITNSIIVARIKTASFCELNLNDWKNRLVTIFDKFTDFFSNPTYPTIDYFNVQSLNAHTLDVLHDPVLPKATLLSMSETWMQDNLPAIDAVGYRCIARKNNGKNRAGGVAISESLTSGLETTHKLSYENTNVSYGDVCCARIEYRSRNQKIQHFYLITIYAKPGVTKNQVMQLMDIALMRFSKYTLMFAINHLNSLYSSPLLICADFNYNVNCPELTTYLQDRYSVSLATKSLITSRNGTSIDGIFYRNEQFEIIPYVLYFRILVHMYR